MSIPGSSGALFLATAAGAGGYQVERSLRFNSSDSAYLSRTPASAGNRKTWTWAAWVKRSDLANQQTAWSAGSTGTNRSNVLFQGGGQIRFFNYAGSVDVDLITTPVYRDASAWYHLVITVDTTQATSTNRFKLYVNDVQVTVFSTATYPSLNQDLVINSAIAHGIGRGEQSGGEYFSGYLADIHFIDGQALTPSSFTEVSATTGQLVPKAYSGSYGTNGFKLTFSDNSNNTATTLGKDTSGNGNNWTPNNFSVLDGRTSVAAATGALPVYNTTDTYGAALGSGVRSDSFASSLVLAAPLTTQGGGSLTNDVSPSGRTSSTKTLTNTNVTSSTSVSKYYGGSAVFSSSSSSAIDIAASSDFQFGSGDFTVEFWIYPTNTTGQNVLGYGNSSGGTGFALIKTASQFQGQFAMSDGTKVFTGGSYTVNTWNHVAAVRSGSTITLYVNGTSSATASTSGSVTTGTDGFAIGRYGLYGGSCDAQFQDVRVYKGVAKYTSNFTPPTSVQNVTTAAGCDSLVDTPSSAGTDTGVGGVVTGNYATINPLSKAANATLSNGNLDVTNTVSGSAGCASTIGMSSGKWYCEVTVNAVGSETKIGICKENAIQSEAGSVANSWAYGNNGEKFNSNANTSYGNSFTTGDVIGIAFDADAGSLYFYKNGTVQNSGTAAYTSLTSGPYFFQFTARAVGSANNLSVNFGQRPFAYTAPSGFKALCDTNLPAPVVAKPNTVMDVKLYTGNGSTQTISGLGFSPDLVWLKCRSDSYAHRLFDQVRGATKVLYSNLTAVEDTISGVTAFNSDGFTLGSETGGNVSGQTFVAWTWDAGSAANPTTNTQGSITSSVRANATAGFSIVTYTGTGSNATVGHGLGVAPFMFIVKNRGTSSDWDVYHGSLATPATNRLVLQSTAAVNTGTSAWNSTNPTSTVVSLGVSTSANANGNTHVLYCFAPVAGYSSFGSYTGNGSTDGPFVFCGFRPRWILRKRTDTSGPSWRIIDTARNPYNLANEILEPNTSDATENNNEIDVLSNGFKVRSTDTDGNANGGTIIYAAFAENPFAYARAR